jgi:ubiquinone/menaquinone biosynthesis C-methylase UbiE
MSGLSQSSTRTAVARRPRSLSNEKNLGRPADGKDELRTLAPGPRRPARRDLRIRARPPLPVTARPNRVALELFAPLGPSYDRYARLLSLGQDARWRTFLVSQIDAGPGDTLLDVATGTAAVAIELVRRTGCTVVGVDQSPEMLAVGRERVARAGLGDRIRLVEAGAERLPFRDAEFAGLTVTYLLRYVQDPAATMCELARVVRPGGVVVGLEFGVPRGWPGRFGVSMSTPACRSPGGYSRPAGAASATSWAAVSARSPRTGRPSAWRPPGRKRASARSGFGG